MNNKIENGIFIEEWDGRNILEEKGIYFFSFEINGKNTIEKIIIEE